MEIGDQARCRTMYRSSYVLRTVCVTCTFVRGMSKLYKLAKIISFIPGQKCKFSDRQSGRTTAFATWFGSEPGHLSLCWYKYKAEKPFSYSCFHLIRRPVQIRSCGVYLFNNYHSMICFEEIDFTVADLDRPPNYGSYSTVCNFFFSILYGISIGYNTLYN